MQNLYSALFTNKSAPMHPYIIHTHIVIASLFILVTMF